MTIIIIAAAVTTVGLFDALSLKFGVDTRPGFDKRTPIT